MGNIRPYIGITGPSSRKEVSDVINEFSNIGHTMNSKHIPMLGFLVSNKTLQGTETKNRRYPAFSELRGLLEEANGKVLAMVHYNTKKKDSLTSQVWRVFNGIYDEGLCMALQLNVVWPDVMHIAAIKTMHPKMQIVLQASHKAMAKKNPKEIVNIIEMYGSSISYVLIDPSGGRGLEFDVENSLNVYSEIKSRLPSLTVGFAGGFTGKNIKKKLQKIIKATGSKDFCIDAESGLRDKLSDEYGDDLLNINKVRKYLKEAYSVFK